MRVFWLIPLLAGCSSITAEDGWERQLGMVEPSLSSVYSLQLPAQVDAGVPFVGIVRTVGSSSCTRALDTESDVDGLTATVRPWDLYAREQACTDDLHPFPHPFTLTFNTAGQAKVVVHARKLNGEPHTIEQTITVRPGSGETWTRRVGVTHVGISSVPLADVPSAIYAGVPFQVVIHTLGSSSCTVPDGEDVAVSLNAADITPYDRYAPPGRACTADISPIDHAVTLTFRAIGQARIRVHGRSNDGGMRTETITVNVRAH